jgi:hypothetical protein
MFRNSTVVGEGGLGMGFGVCWTGYITVRVKLSFCWFRQCCSLRDLVHLDGEYATDNLKA